MNIDEPTPEQYRGIKKGLRLWSNEILGKAKDRKLLQDEMEVDQGING